ncbi:MAG: hypothetical protein HYY09_08730 [Firmicutes bacterium]|nr:hypothetical protein [Bacillota bacterium]
MENENLVKRRSLDEVKQLIEEVNTLSAEAAVPISLNIIGQYTFGDLGMTLTYGAKGCRDTCTGCKGSCSGACAGCTGCSGCSGTTQIRATQQPGFEGFWSLLQDPRIAQILAVAANNK